MRLLSTLFSVALATGASACAATLGDDFAVTDETTAGGDPASTTGTPGPASTGSGGGGGGGAGAGGGPSGPKEWHVDAARGDDANPGDVSMPFRTLARAVLAVQPKDVIAVHAGTYDAALGESWGYVLPSDVHVRAADPAIRPVIEGPGAAAGSFLTLTGTGSTVEGFDVRKFAAVVTSAGGTHGVIGLGVTEVGIAVSVSGGKVTVKDLVASLLTTAVTVSGKGEVAWTGGSVTQTAPACTVLTGGLWALDEAVATVDGVSFSSGFGSAVHLRVNAHVTVDNIVVKGMSDTCGSSSSLVVEDSGTLVVVDADVSGANRSGIYVYGAPVPPALTVTGGSFHDNAFAGIEISAAKATIDGAATSFNEVGVHQTAGSLVLTDVQATGNASAGARSKGGKLTVRKSSLVLNKGYGIDLVGSGVGAKADLGAGDPGLNKLQDNAGAQLRVGWSVPSTVAAAGNTWMPGLQGAGQTGAMKSGATLTGPTDGANFQIDNAGVSLQF
jgi:hypothetical protein